MRPSEAEYYEAEDKNFGLEDLTSLETRPLPRLDSCESVGRERAIELTWVL